MKLVTEEIRIIDRKIDRHDIEDLVQDDEQEFFRSKSPYVGFDHNTGERDFGIKQEPKSILTKPEHSKRHNHS